MIWGGGDSSFSYYNQSRENVTKFKTVAVPALYAFSNDADDWITLCPDKASITFNKAGPSDFGTGGTPGTGTTLEALSTDASNYTLSLPEENGILATRTWTQDEIAHSFSRMGYRHIIPFPNSSTTLELTNGFKMDGDSSPYAIYTRGVIVDIDVKNSGGQPHACSMVAYCSNGNTATVSISTAVAEKRYYLTMNGWRGTSSSSGTFMTSYDDYITKIVYTKGNQMQITGTIDASSDFLQYN